MLHGGSAAGCCCRTPAMLASCDVSAMLLPTRLVTTAKCQASRSQLKAKETTHRQQWWSVVYPHSHAPPPCVIVKLVTHAQACTHTQMPRDWLATQTAVEFPFSKEPAAKERIQASMQTVWRGAHKRQAQQASAKQHARYAFPHWSTRLVQPPLQRAHLPAATACTVSSPSSAPAAAASGSAARVIRVGQQ